MKKLTILILLCLSALLLPGFTTSDPDMTKAKEVLEAYLDAAQRGDINALLEHSAAIHRKAFTENNTMEDPIFQIGLLVMRNSGMEILDMQKTGKNEIDATISIAYPNLQPFFESAAESIIAEKGVDVSEAVIYQEMGPLLAQYLENVQPENFAEDIARLSLIKEKGKWKVDEILN